MSSTFLIGFWFGKHDCCLSGMFSASALLQQCHGAGGKGLLFLSLLFLVLLFAIDSLCLFKIIFRKAEMWTLRTGSKLCKISTGLKHQTKQLQVGDGRNWADFCRKDFLYVIVHSSCMAKDTKVSPHDKIILSLDVHRWARFILVTFENSQAEVCELIQRAVTLFNWRSPRAPPRQSCKHCLRFWINESDGSFVKNSLATQILDHES